MPSWAGIFARLWCWSALLPWWRACSSASSVKRATELTLALPPPPSRLPLGAPLQAITRDSRHKRRATGGRRHPHQKKRKFEVGKPPAMTKIGPKRIHLVRGRGGTDKHRAMRLEHGNFAWGSEHVTRKTRILDVVYNASNNELVRTKTLVKSAVVVIDATPFTTWYKNHYRQQVVKRNVDGSNVISVEDFLPEKAGNSKGALARVQKLKDAKTVRGRGGGGGERARGALARAGRRFFLAQPCHFFLSHAHFPPRRAAQTLQCTHK